MRESKGESKEDRDMVKRSFCALAIGLCQAAFAGGGTTVIINEADCDTVGTDMLEFIELYDGGAGSTALDGLVVVFYNGSSDTSYAAFDLDGMTTDASGYFVLGNAAVTGVDLVFADNFFQNGQDAVALYLGDATSFPNGTAVTTASLVDALVYDTADPDDPGLLVLLNAGQPQVDEAGGASGSAADSMQRCPNGSGGARNTLTYTARPPTPGADNDCPVSTSGACCFADGSCTDGLEPEECAGMGGAHQGSRILCADVKCPVTITGACCNTAIGACTDGLTQADCEAGGGTYGGDDTTCADPIPCAALVPANLVISEVVDGSLPGGQPKWVEITNCDAVAVDLSIYSIGNFNNGSLTLAAPATALAGMLAAGDSYVFAYSASTDMTFETTYGFPPDQFAGGGFINGDDVVALFLGFASGDGSNANLVDVYGEIGVDGTGTAWEYTDSYANRLPGSAATDVFNAAEWTFGGPAALETGDDAQDLILLQTLTFPGVHDCEAKIACPWDLNRDGDVGFADLLAVLSDWGPCAGCPADFDGNNDVGFADLLKVLSEWGPCP
jgi:hypothetical protein